MRYLVAVQLPDDYDQDRDETEEQRAEVNALNEEMAAAGVRLFVGGLELPRRAKSLRRGANGKVQVTDGPYAETKEHVGGFILIEAADMDEAVGIAAGVPVGQYGSIEVRPVMELSAG